jgi:hypothetical protein
MLLLYNPVRLEVNYMSVVVVKKAIQKMRQKLNTLISDNNFDLQDANIQEYSRRLDKAIITYNKKVLNNPENSNTPNSFDSEQDLLTSK